MLNEKRSSRRRFMQQTAALIATALVWPAVLKAKLKNPIRRAIPNTRESLSVIGLGTSRTFDVGKDSAQRAQLAKVLQAFFDYGGGLIDLSPMYGSAEQVTGDLLKSISNKQSLFAATKVWTFGKQPGIAQMRESMRLVGVPRFDLMQIHNLRDWRVQLETLKEWRETGKIRYIGISTSHGRDHSELQQILQREPLDFVQLSYNIDNLKAQQRLLPLAKERGIATIINRPFQRGDLFSRVSGKPLPKWADEFECETWAQFFLKFIVSHPDVTCAIPATSKPHHLVDNMTAGFGALPDEKMRVRMLRYFRTL